MFTRGHVRHQYGNPGPGDQSAPPWHVTMHPHQYTPWHPTLGRPQGLAGGAVILEGLPSTDLPAGQGFRYLGMDPSDPATWPRPFNPQPGMSPRIDGVCYR